MCRSVGLPFLLLVAASCASSERSAYEFCKQEVIKELTSPASARFPDRNDPALTINAGDGEAFISGHVDSQNAFGAMMRSNFVCSLETNQGKWAPTLVSVLPAR